jgi:CRP-like cAMP-binding protein
MSGHDPNNPTDPSDTAEGALLAFLTDSDRAYLLAQGVRRRFRANDVVLMEGDPSDHVHVLVAGWVRVSTIVEDGREVLFALRGPGEVLGELAAIHGWARTASCRAIEACTVVQLTASQFLAVLRARPEIAIATIKTVAARLRNAESARVDSAAFDVSRRVAVHLVRMADEHGRSVPEGVVIEAALSQADIAAQVGAARRTVARALGVLRERGVVETGRRRILIRRMRVLRALARSEPNGTQRP